MYVLNFDKEKISLYEKIKANIAFGQKGELFFATLNNMYNTLAKNSSESHLKHDEWGGVNGITLDEELELAKDIIEFELHHTDIRYRHNLCQYFYYFINLPNNLKNLFYACHGLPVKTLNGIEKKILNAEKYAITLSGQEILSTYIVHEGNSGWEDLVTLLKTLRESIQFINVNNGFVVQLINEDYLD